MTEPMMLWPMGAGGDLVARFTECFDRFLEVALPLGIVWASGHADGLAVWTAPEQRRAWDVHPWEQQSILDLTEDRGHRYTAFWDWVALHDPSEPSWQLDTIAVAPERQGPALGRALAEAGLANAQAPGGRPRICFMRRDPRTPMGSDLPA